MYLSFFFIFQRSYFSKSYKNGKFPELSAFSSVLHITRECLIRDYIQFININWLMKGNVSRYLKILVKLCGPSNDTLIGIDKNE